MPLTPAQEAIIQTPAFQSWFGNSKVVDQDGKPLIVYHGTSKDTDFDKFSDRDRGIYLTTSSKDASSYAQNNDSQDIKYVGRFHPRANHSGYMDVNTASRVFPLFASIKNPYYPTPEEWSAQNQAKSYAAWQREHHGLWRRQGFDGVDYGGGTWVAFQPTQVKSATGNKGNFDPTKPKLIDEGYMALHLLTKKILEDYL